MRARGLLTIATALVALLVLDVRGAAAGPAADAHTDTEGIETEARNDHRGEAPLLPGTEKKQDETPPQCDYAPVDAETAAIADRLAAKGWGNPKGEGEGAWYRRTCYLQNRSGEFSDVVWVAARRVDPAAMAEEARDRLPLPAPIIRMNPPPDAGKPHVVNGPPTWLYLDAAMWRSYSSTVAVPGVSVTATAEPVRVLWDMGTGDPPVPCHGPGKPYAQGQAPDCSYVWPRASRDEPGGRFTVTVTVEWQASWTVTGAPGGGALPGIRRTAFVQVEVREKQAVNTKP